MEFTRHFNLMLKERMISQEWVEKTLKSPDHVENREDGSQHFIKKIPEYGNRWLRVVINVRVDPNRAVTAFFDRRLRRTAL
jgi:hypothetical protein